MKVVTRSQMQEMDRGAVAAGVPSLTLMERAGRGLLRSLVARVPHLSSRPVWILCGKGNNGGDGLVLSRLLLERGIRCKTILLAERSSLSGDAAINAERAERLGLVLSAPSESAREQLARLGPDAVIVDALLGTGLTGPAHGILAEWIEAASRSRACILAVDIPSGMAADDFRTSGPVMRASWTVTMAWPKRSFFFAPARGMVGGVDLVDIGIPESVTDEVGWDAQVLTPEEAASWLPSGRERDHKGRWGRLLVAGGSPGLAGAPGMASRAALRCGSGLVRTAVPVSIAPLAHSAASESMTIHLPEGEEGQILASGADRLLSGFGNWDALVIGPGLGRFPDTDRFVLKLLGGWSRPMVIDADALNVLAAWGPDSWIPRAREIRAAGIAGGVVLTPHAGELARLTGSAIDSLQSDPISTARIWAERWGTTLVFKGAPSVIASPEGEVWVNPTGNSGLATGGSGDILSGIIGALLGQGMDGPRAAVLGCYLHGLAADLWVSEPDRAQRSLLPSDVIETLPRAIRDVEERATPPRWRWRWI